MVFGASPNAFRYSFSATLLLQEYGFEVIPMGIHLGQIGGQNILDLNQMPLLPDIDTITMYLNPFNQKQMVSVYTRFEATPSDIQSW